MTTELLEVKKEFHAFTDYRAELMDAVDEGRVSPELMIICLIKYMSQDDVKDCLKINGLLAPEITLIKEGFNYG
jgi:hypothetical protein